MFSDCVRTPARYRRLGVNLDGIHRNRKAPSVGKFAKNPAASSRVRFSTFLVTFGVVGFRPRPTREPTVGCMGKGTRRVPGLSAEGAAAVACNPTGLPKHLQIPPHCSVLLRTAPYCAVLPPVRPVRLPYPAVLPYILPYSRTGRTIGRTLAALAVRFRTDWNTPQDQKYQPVKLPPLHSAQCRGNPWLRAPVLFEVIPCHGHGMMWS